MALSALEKQAVFIKNLDNWIEKKKTDDLPAYDQSEVQDLIQNNQLPLTPLYFN